MEEQRTDRQWMTIEVSAAVFNQRLDQLDVQTPVGALLSRLAFIHKVAKAFAIEAVSQSVISVTDLAIEEITDPPLYGYTSDDDPVIIQFSYHAL